MLFIGVWLGCGGLLTVAVLVAGQRSAKRSGSFPCTAARSVRNRVRPVWTMQSVQTRVTFSDVHVRSKSFTPPMYYGYQDGANWGLSLFRRRPTAR